MINKTKEMSHWFPVSSIDHMTYLQDGTGMPVFNSFPKEFEGWWINLVFPKNLIAADFVFIMYKNNLFETGTILESKKILNDYPDFMVVYKKNPNNAMIYNSLHIYMNPKYRGKGLSKLALPLLRSIMYEKYKILISYPLNTTPSAFAVWKSAEKLVKGSVETKIISKFRSKKNIDFKKEAKVERNLLYPFIWYNPRFIGE